MFWRKKEKKIEELTAKIQVIPEDFYGAKDPVIHYSKNTTTKNTVLPVQSVVKENAGVAAHEISQIKPPTWLKSRKMKIILEVVFLVSAVVVISWYYINQALQIKKQNIPAPTSVVQAPTEEVVETPNEEVAPTSTLELEILVEEPVAPTSTEPVLEFPNVQLLDGADLDNDSLTDLEEELFAVDPSKWDTDGDGYYDGQEVFNLYNPQGIAPMKIVDSGLVKEYVNPVWQYRLYYPAQWALGTVEAEANHVLFSSLSGDFVEVVAQKMNSGETFSDWFVRQAVGQQFSGLQEFTNHFKENGWKRNDDLVAYFISEDNVFTILYHPGSLDTISYRHIVQMVIQSFRPTQTTLVIPEQPMIPPEGVMVSSTAEEGL